MIDSATAPRTTRGETRTPGHLETAAPDPSLRYVYGKRCLDLVIAAIALVVLMPLILAISLIVVIDSGWPVFYRQKRVGARCRRVGRRREWVETSFSIIKFRTMVREADSYPVHERFIESFVSGDSEVNGADTVYKLTNDRRVTRSGRLLRVSSLDELPQLLNVLAGTMSLVGPRPVPPYEVALYKPSDRERLAALPGITGPWQVYGRGRVGFEEMVRMDVEYVRAQSLRNDLWLLAKTVPAVLNKGGAR